MSLITLQGLGFDYGRQTILKEENLTVHAGERYGLVGMNGAGKTTLMRLMAGLLQPVRGSLQRAARISVGYLPQDTELDSSEGLLDAVRKEAFGDLQAVEARLGELTDRMGSGDSSPELMEEYGRLHERFESADGYTMDSRTEAALHGLGFGADRFAQPVATFSGGQKRRAALAATLLAPHDVLLIDEPTNHLDLEAREWLESHFADRPGALVAISHDRTFLDNVTQYTLHLVNGRLNRFVGGYTKFHKQWEEQKESWNKHYLAQKDHIERTEAFIRKNIAGQRTNQAKSRRKQLDRLDRMEAPPNEGRRYKFNLKPRRESSSVVFEAHGIGRSFEALTLFRDVDFQVLKNDKIGILGPNGTGKTTLLRLLTRELEPSAGRVVTGGNVDLGYYDQNLTLTSDGHTPIDELRVLEPLAPEGDLRSLLGAFGFDDNMVEQKVGTFSGGERARITLLKLIMEKHNTLLLDEPTNHLDTDTREALEDALVAFHGTIVVVSHDRYFLNRICNRIFAFESVAGGGTGGMRQFLGNYDDYKYRMAAEREKKSASVTVAEPVEKVSKKSVPTAPSAASTPVDTKAKTKRQLSKNELRKLRREVADLEEEISFLEVDVETLGGQMGSASGREMADLAKKAAKAQATLDGKMKRWEELNRLLER